MENVFFNRDALAAEKSILENNPIPSLYLMESAGNNAAQFINNYISDKNYSNIIIFCGKGNNAGDGFVIAEYFCLLNFPVTLVLCYDSNLLKGDALICYNKLISQNFISLDILTFVEFRNSFDFSNLNSLIVDSVFGIGFTGSPDDYLSSIINFINSFGKNNIVSIDIPSGLSSVNSEITVNASITLSMGVYKFETLFLNGKKSSGNLNLVNIGISSELFSNLNTKNIFLLEKKDFTTSSRNINSNKYTNGKVFIISGNIKYPGASILSAKAAFRAGCGAVISAIPENIYSQISENVIESVKYPLAVNKNNGILNNSVNFQTVLEGINWSDCTLIGPGLGRDEDTLNFVRKIINEIPGKYIIDADAISAFSNSNELFNPLSEIIITPHGGEFLNLSGISKNEFEDNIYQFTQNFASKNRIHLLLKLSASIYTNGKLFLISNFGKENLATFGTGDVLSGILAAQFAKLKSAETAAINSLLIQGLSSNYLYDKNQNSMMASDLLDIIPKILIELENQ